jgi:hypothetical protein
MGGVAVLFRPVGQLVVDLIESSDWRAFPPGLDWQLISHPGLTEENSATIARDWKAMDAADASVDHELKFEAYHEERNGHQVSEAGGRACGKHWITAELIDDINRSYVGQAIVSAVCRG